MWLFGYLLVSGAQNKPTLDRDTEQLVGSTTDLYLDQGNHNVLFLNRLFFSHMQHGKKCAVRSISALFYLCLSLSPSLFIFFLLTHSISFVLPPLNAPSLDSLCVLNRTYLLSLSLASLVFVVSLICFFFLFPSQAVFPPLRSSLFPPSRWALPPDILPLHLQLRLNWAEHI